MEISPRTAPTIEESLEPGYVFQPTDEELAVDYLFSWITNKKVPCDIVILDDIYRIEPWILLALYKREVEGYFLVRVTDDRKFGARKKRTVGEGSYTIQKRNGDDGTLDGSLTWRKSTFNFQCKEEGERKRKRKTSGWVMHELEITSMETDWVLCRVKLSNQEVSRRKRYKEGQSEKETDSDTYSSGVEHEKGTSLLVSTSSDGDPPNLQPSAQMECWVDEDWEQDPLAMLNLDDQSFLEMEGLLDCSISGIEAEEQQQQEIASHVDDDPILVNLDYFLDLDLGIDETESAGIDQVAELNQGQELVEVGRDEEEDLMLTFENLGELERLPGFGFMDMFEDYY